MPITEIDEEATELKDAESEINDYISRERTKEPFLSVVDKLLKLQKLLQEEKVDVDKIKIVRKETHLAKEKLQKTGARNLQDSYIVTTMFISDIKGKFNMKGEIAVEKILGQNIQDFAKNYIKITKLTDQILSSAKKKKPGPQTSQDERDEEGGLRNTICLIIIGSLSVLAYALSGDVTAGLTLATMGPFIGGIWPENEGYQAVIKFYRQFKRAVEIWLRVKTDEFKTYMRKGQYQEAQRLALLLHDFSNVGEKSYQRQLEFGTAFFMGGQYQLAIPHFREALRIIRKTTQDIDSKSKIHRDILGIYFKLGTSYLLLAQMEKDTKRKVALLRKAISNLKYAEQDDYMVEHNLREAERELKEAQGVVEEVLEDILVDPEERFTDEDYKTFRISYAVRVFNHGTELQGNEEFDKAISYFEEALRIADNSPEFKDMLPSIYISLGETYLAKKDYSKAIETLKLASRLADKNSILYMHSLVDLISAYFSIGEEEDMRSLAEEVVIFYEKRQEKQLDMYSSILDSLLGESCCYLAQTFLNSNDIEMIKQAKTLFLQAAELFAKSQDLKAMAQAKTKAESIDKLIADIEKTDKKRKEQQKDGQNHIGAQSGEAQAFRAKDGGRWFWWSLLAAIPGLLGAWWLGMPKMIIVLGSVFVWAIIKYGIMEWLPSMKISDKLVEVGVIGTYKEAYKLAREIDIGLSTIDYREFKTLIKQYKALGKECERLKRESFPERTLQVFERGLHTAREELKGYLTERDIIPQAADVFLDLALSKNPINRLVARWIMTHEEVEAQFKSHIMGMLGVFPAIGKIIWVIGRVWQRLLAILTSIALASL